MDDLRVRKASELLSSVLSPAASVQAGMWTGFFGFWAKAAGENLAAHSRPVDVRNGIVFIEAEHPGWIQLLQVKQDQLLATIQKNFPELGISGIAFRLARDGTLPGTAKTSYKQPSMGTELAGTSTANTASAATGTELELEETLERVEDESFRGILSSLAETLKKAD